MQKFQELEVWQRGHKRALEIYRITRAFPTEERFGLTSQMRRAAYSVPMNIAERSKKVSHRDYARFLNMAEASLAEVEYQVILATDLGFTQPASAKELEEGITTLAKKLYNLRRKVEGNSG
jgi:four helix bundle protein